MTDRRRILVAHARTANSKAPGRARELLEQVNAHVIGVSVNQVAPDQRYGYGYGYGGYGDHFDSAAHDTASVGENAKSRKPSRIFSR